MNCDKQCEGCAFKPGAAANREADNKLRGVLTALGSIPFFCHSALGWHHDKPGYPLGATQALDVLASRKLQKALHDATGNDPLADPDLADFRKQVRTCAGWRASVARLKAAGWFANKDVNLIRRHVASSAARDLVGLSEKKQGRKQKAMRLKNIRKAFDWFMNEARESGVKIGWLLK